MSQGGNLQEICSNVAFLLPLMPRLPQLLTIAEAEGMEKAKRQVLSQVVS